MNWDQIEGDWKQMKGHFRAKWGKFTDDDLELIAGRRDVLAGRLQEHYGLAMDVAEKQLDDFASALIREDHLNLVSEKSSRG